VDIQDIIDAIRYNRIRITDHADEEAQADHLSFDEIFFFEPYKIYYLATPYNMFGAGKALMDAMRTADTNGG